VGERVLRSLTINETEALRAAGAAESMTRLLEAKGPEAKMVAWAHNAHFQRTPFFPGVQSMAGHLSRSLGDEHVTVGFAFGEGEFRGIDLASGEIRAFGLAPAPPGTFDAALATVDHPIYAIDLRKSPRSGPTHEWLRGCPPMRVMTSVWTDDEDLATAVWDPLDKPNGFSWADPRDCFDILIYVKTTTAARGHHDWPWAEFSPVRGEVHADPGALRPEAGSDGQPIGWLAELGSGPAAYSLEITDGACAVSRGSAPAYWPGDAQLSRTFKANAYRGTRVRFSARTGSDRAEIGDGTYVYLRADPPASAAQGQFTYDNPLAFALGSQHAELEVSPSAETLTIGLVFSGIGQAEFHDLAFSAVDG
jgi:hypothetical protein